MHTQCVERVLHGSTFIFAIVDIVCTKNIKAGTLNLICGDEKHDCLLFL